MTIYFDMDGTIANLYGVENWLDYLMNEKTVPYDIASPMVDLERLAVILEELRSAGVRIGIISWLSKNSSDFYKKLVTKAKKEWLKKNFPVTFDETHFVKYGTRKDYVAKDKDGILFDDDERVREKWRGLAFNPENFDILEVVQNLKLAIS